VRYIPLSARTGRHGLLWKCFFRRTCGVRGARIQIPQVLITDRQLNAAEAVREVPPDKTAPVGRAFAVEESWTMARGQCRGQDAGIGFGEGEADHLFEAFLQPQPRRIGWGSRSVGDP